MKHWEDKWINGQTFCLPVCFIINPLCTIILTSILTMQRNKPLDGFRYRCFLLWRLSLSKPRRELFANSLALLTDAAHNFTDVIALGISWYAVHLTTQPSNSKNTYGYHRAGILAAMLNSTTLVLISLGIFYEAYRRFINPPQVNSLILISVGFLALTVNLISALLLHQSNKDDLNLRSAFLHMIGDVASAVGAVVAGVIIYFTHANWLDPFISGLIGCLILYNAWGNPAETVDILLEVSAA